MATCTGPVAEISSSFTPVLAAIGGVTITYVGGKLLYGLYSLLTTYVFAGISDLKKYGEWAVVTGATDGIGKAYAQELARKGLNIVLISRTAEKLQDVATELESLNSGIRTKIIVADFTQGWALEGAISKGLAGIDVGVLVNNVGMGYGYPEFFLQVPDIDQRMKDMMECNVTSVLMMTKLVLPDMVKKKKGVVINVSSASAFRPTPLLTLYSATKAFVDYFSEGMNQEYRGRGIIFQSVLPFFVATKLAKIRRATLMAPSPSDFVRSALATVGLVSRTTGYITHQIQAKVMDLLPGWLIDHLAIKQFMVLRRKALKYKKSQ